MAPDCLCKGKRFSLSFTRSVFIAWSPRKPSLSGRDKKNFISPFYLCYRLWGRRENMKAKLVLFPGPASCSLRRKQIMIQISGKNQKLLIQPFLNVLPYKNEFECLHRDLKRFPPLERPAHYLFVCTPCARQKTSKPPKPFRSSLQAGSLPPSSEENFPLNSHKWACPQATSDHRIWINDTNFLLTSAVFKAWLVVRSGLELTTYINKPALY